MVSDAYEPCPCGSGKKVKFCCSKDITAELDKIQKAIQSDQRVAALEQINRLIATKGERDCLLATKAAIYLHLKQFDELRELVDAFLERNPDNALMLAHAAVLALDEQDVDEAVVLLQNALDQIGDSMPFAVLEAIRLVGVTLHMLGRFPAARTHLAMYQQLLNQEDPELAMLMMRSFGSPNIPIFLKEDFALSRPPEGAEWAEEYAQAHEMADRGCFRSAVERLRELEARYPQEPLLRRNIAVLETRLGDLPAIVDAWRNYAGMEAIRLDQAVEAEAIAQLLDDDPDREFVSEMRITIPITDVEAVSEKLLSSPQFDPSRRDTFDTPEDSPPPRAAFNWLDKPVPTAEELTLENIPTIVGEIFLYGKETDRDGRIEIMAIEDDRLAAQLEALRADFGDLLKEETGREELDRHTRQAAALTWRWRFPEGVDNDKRRELVVGKQRVMMLEVWPTLPLDVLDGKTPQECAGDDNYTVRLLAAILLMEESADFRVARNLDINELRRSLDLPTRDPIDPAEIDLADLSLVRFKQLEFEKMASHDLVRACTIATLNGMAVLIEKIYRLLLERDDIDEEMFDPLQAYAMLARLTEDNDEAMELIHKAQTQAAANDQPVGIWVVLELELRLERGMTDGTSELLQKIDRRHMQEPGVANELGRVFYRFGLLDEYGRPVTPDGGPPAEPMPGEEEVSTGQIWTPTAAGEPSTPTPPPQEEGPSKLWLPGSD